MTTTEKLEQNASRFSLAQVDRSIAAWIRQYTDAGSSDWQRAENSLMRILLDLATIPPESLMPSDGQADVVANALARALGNCDRAADYSTDYLRTLSALAFAAAGNFPSANILAKRASRNLEPGSAERWLMSVLARERLSLSETTVHPPTDEFRRYAQLTDHALRLGQQEYFDRASTALSIACRESFQAVAPSDRYLLLFWQQIHKRFQELSVARLLHDLEFPNEAYIAELVSALSPLFYPSQARTLRDQPLTRPGLPVLVALPTGTGKSLLGEIALVSSLSRLHRNRWLAVYLAPYRALTDQLQERMQGRLRSIDIECIIRRGGYLSDLRALSTNLPTVLVATPEAFDALLRQRPELYEALAACVFDEFHLIEQQGRGLRYEGLLGRMLCGATGEHRPKVVALSAVIEDTTRITRWLDMEEKSVARLPWRATGQRLGVIDPSGNIQYFAAAEKLPGTTGPEEIAWSGELDLPNYLRLPSVNYTAVWNDYRGKVAENVARVAVDQWNRLQEPVLVICSSRLQTRAVARMATLSLQQVDEENSAHLLARRIHARFPYLYTLQQCLKHGVAYHNAGLPDWIRTQMQTVIDDRKIRIVAATTTLAEGVDLPFRVVVLADWRLYLFGQKQPMPTLLFHNIAGRCGRTWEFTEGDTIIVDCPDRNLGDYISRRERYMELYVNPPPYTLYSSVERDMRSDSRMLSIDTRSVLESQFTAHVAACNQSEFAEREFTGSLYAGSQDDAAALVHDAMVEFTDYVITEPNHPVMERESPLQLTDFGQVVLRTGLSPRSGIALAYFIQDYLASPSSGTGEGSEVRKRYGITWEPIIASLWDRVRKQSDIYELESYAKQRIGDAGYPVRSDNFCFVAMAWTSGVPLELITFQIFRAEPDEKEQIAGWLDGREEAPTTRFEEYIEQVAVFCSQYLAEQWSWIFRAISTVAEEYLDASDIAAEARGIERRLKYGVKHQATADLLQSKRPPIDRAKLDWLVWTFQLYTFVRTEVLDISLFRRWIRENKGWLADSQIAGSQFSSVRLDAEDIDELLQSL
jgi:helicase